MAHLWHMRSDVLDGFYASEVYVSAEDQPQAIEVALQAYDIWLTQQIDDYLYHPLISLDPDDVGYDIVASAKRTEFAQELRIKLVRQSANGIILRKT